MLQAGVAEEFSCRIFGFCHAVCYQKDASSGIERCRMRGEVSPVHHANRKIRPTEFYYTSTVTDQRSEMPAINVVKSPRFVELQNAQSRILADIFFAYELVKECRHRAERMTRLQL